MATFGASTATPNGGAYYFVSSGKNQYCSEFTAPVACYITQVSAYFDLYSGSGTCYVCVWDGPTGNLLGSASVGTVGAGTQSPGAQHWHTGTLAGSGILISAGQQVWLGCWTPGNCLWTTESSGTTISNAQSGGPGSLAGNNTEQGHGFGAYATYTPAGVWVAPTGTPQAPVAIWGNPGSGPAHVQGVWASNGSGGVKRIW